MGIFFHRDPLVSSGDFQRVFFLSSRLASEGESHTSQRLLKGIRGGGRPPPGFGAMGGGVGALRVGAGRVGIKGGAGDGIKSGKQISSVAKL